MDSYTFRIWEKFTLNLLHQPSLFPFLPLYFTALVVEILTSQERKKREELTLLYEVSKGLMSTVDLPEILSLIANNLKKVFKYDFCSIRLVDQKLQTDPQVKSIFSLPIISEGQVIAILTVGSHQQTRFLGKDVELLNILAKQISPVLKNALLYQSTQQEAVTDGLTKAYK